MARGEGRQQALEGTQLFYGRRGQACTPLAARTRRLSYREARALGPEELTAQTSGDAGLRARLLAEARKEYQLIEQAAANSEPIDRLHRFAAALLEPEIEPGLRRVSKERRERLKESLAELADLGLGGASALEIQNFLVESGWAPESLFDGMTGAVFASELDKLPDWIDKVTTGVPSARFMLPFLAGKSWFESDPPLKSSAEAISAGAKRFAAIASDRDRQWAWDAKLRIGDWAEPFGVNGPRLGRDLAQLPEDPPAISGLPSTEQLEAECAELRAIYHDLRKMTRALSVGAIGKTNTALDHPMMELQHYPQLRGSLEQMLTLGEDRPRRWPWQPGESDPDTASYEPQCGGDVSAAGLSDDPLERLVTTSLRCTGGVRAQRERELQRVARWLLPICDACDQQDEERGQPVGQTACALLRDWELWRSVADQPQRSD